MVDHLVGISEIAGMLGVTRQRAVQLVADYPDFPNPTATLAAGRIWERQVVEEWIARHPQRRPGRRRQSGEPASGKGVPS